MFLNIVKNVKIAEYENLNSNFENVKTPVFQAILKYKSQASIIEIKGKLKKPKFTFDEVDNEKIIKEIKRLNKNKTSQKFDFPITLLKKTLIFLQVFR